MYGLIDCNNFFASCERVFNPSLNGRPIVVLSNNDGCVIARSNEAKKLGIKMGTPAYQIKQMIDRKQVYAFSSNNILYGDMSSRIMSILNSFVPNIEIYSIDEAFIRFDGIKDIKEFAKEIVYKITKSTGIPVSLGVAKTKTLAKIANKFAKKYKAYNQVCIIDNEEKRLKALKLTEVKEVWGIGRKLAKKLAYDGIFTAYEFTEMPEYLVRKKMTVTGDRIWQELRGVPSIDMDSIESDKKQICTSRSFGKTVKDFESLTQAVSSFASACAKKLREQKSCANSLLVFINTDRFRNDLPQWWQSNFINFPMATSDTAEIIHYALTVLKKIYADGFSYKKAGVIVSEIVPEKAVQIDLFDNKNRNKSDRLMKAIDDINYLYQSRKIRFAVEGFDNVKWNLRRELLSPNYTTKISEIIEIKC